MPRYFFRGHFTSGVVGPTMACVKWINFILDTRDRTTFIGRIRLTEWNTWPLQTSTSKNQFISTTTLQPSRYALAYTPTTHLSVYVDVAFIALDAENLGEISSDQFTTDFGDNKFPYYKGRASYHLQNEEEDDDDDEANHPQEHATGETFKVLKTYLPKSVLTFLLDPDPLRFIN